MNIGRMRKTMASAVVVTATAMIATALGAAPANAATTFDPLAIVQQRGLLGGDSAVAQEKTLAAQAQAEDATVGSAKPLTLTATNDGLSAAKPSSTNASVQTASNFGVVAGLNDQGNNSSFIAMKDASAPKDYGFTVDEPGAQLKLESNGAVTITDGSGNLINYIDTPWATDAAGNDLSTTFTVDGNTITQHVDTTGATFPVVADPQQGCGIGHCSIYFNKSETKDIGSAGLTALGGATAACAFGGAVAVFACAAATASIGATAQYAENHKQCVGIVYTTTPPPLTEWNPFAYSGKQCK